MAAVARAAPPAARARAGGASRRRRADEDASRLRPRGRPPRLRAFTDAVGSVERRHDLLLAQAAFKRARLPLANDNVATVRPMRAADVRALTEVMSGAFKGTPDERPRARVAKYLLDQLEPNPEEICLVAVLGDDDDDDDARGEEDGDASPRATATPVAIASLSFTARARGDPANGGARSDAGAGSLPVPTDAPYLCNMAVDAAHRRKGLARALLSACDDLVVEMGGADVWLHVRANDAAATALYESAIDDYGACLELAKPGGAGPAVPLFERAQAYKRLERWDDARRDYAAAAVAFADARARKEQKIAEAQAAFATFETGDVAAARRQLETLSRQLYSSDVRAALVACYWVAGDAARAEDLWLSLCEMDASRCGNRRESEYADAGWLLERRKWTPGLAAGMGDFLALRPAAAAVE